MSYDIPIWTLIFLTVCVILFVLGFASPIDDHLSFVPALAFARPWTFITSIFLHADISHLFFNMFALVIFGIYLEQRINKKQFILIFFLAGIAGNFAYLFTSPGSNIPAVGASGAIYGIMGALAVLTPLAIVYFSGVPMPMIVAAGVWAVINFLGTFTPSLIGYEAHLAGLFVGIAFGIYLKMKIKGQRTLRGLE